MKYNEVRIGNLVLLGDTAIKIMGSDFYGDKISTYTPIPATEDNVRKYFVLSDGIDLLGNEKEEIQFRGNEVSFMSEYYCICTCRFIHEIQNYYYAVHKEELPLK